MRLQALIDDSDDPEIGENMNQIYAILRPKLNTSYLLIECLNLFGYEGGFDRLVGLIAKQKITDLNLLQHLLSCLEKSIFMLHRDFAK